MAAHIHVPETKANMMQTTKDYLRFKLTPGHSILKSV